VSKPLPAPKSWKNTYFWIAGLLIVVALLGFAKGQEFIRDPGQRDENGLTFIYLGAALVMLINGYISHTSYVRQFNDSVNDPELGAEENSLQKELDKANVASENVEVTTKEEAPSEKS